MKPVIETYKDQDGQDIVCISKCLKGLSAYDRSLEIKKLVKTEIKQFEFAISYVIVSTLFEDYGIMPTDSSDEALQSAMKLLKEKYGLWFEIEDIYEHTKLKVVHKELKQTCVLDDDDYISIANKIVVRKELK